MKFFHRFRSFKLINYILNLSEKQIIRYGITGVIFTITSPFLFVFLSNLFPRLLVISILNPCSYTIKFFVYKMWVYKNQKVTLLRYIFHVIPLYFISILFTSLTLDVDRTEFVGIGLIILNGGFGYVWGKFLYAFRNK